MSTEAANNDLNMLIDPTFTNVNRLFVSAYQNDADRQSFSQFYLPRVMVKDFNVIIDTLLLADVFNNFRDMCIKEYKLDPAHFLSLPGLVWQACLKKTNIELELLTDYDILLMLEEGIRGVICHSIHRYAKANNKYMKNYHNSNHIFNI